MTSTNCPACKALAPMGIQCNHHRKVAPSARTTKQAEMVAYIRKTGCTPAEAEAHFGVTAGATVR